MCFLLESEFGDHTFFHVKLQSAYKEIGFAESLRAKKHVR